MVLIRHFVERLFAVSSMKSGNFSAPSTPPTGQAASDALNVSMKQERSRSITPVVATGYLALNAH
jgi:hypothetical protein